MYQNDEEERNLSCKCTVLCYILEYMYILHITKRCIGPVLAFNVQIPDQVECLPCLHVESKHRACVSLCYLYNIYILYSNM